MDKVAEVFRANRRPDSRHYLSRNIDDNLRLQYRGYANTDPPTKQQKAITPSFYRHNYNRSTTQSQKVLRTLSIAAFLWACRSCEYVKATFDQKTKLCCIRNIRFFSRTRKLHLYDPNLPNSERVTWNFEEQKKNETNVTIPQENNNNNPIINPVQSLVSTVQRILSYPSTSINSYTCTHMIDGKLLEFTQDHLLPSFRSNTASIGEDKLGFKPEDIGTHSNICATPMAMFKDDTLVYMIMLMERWSSDAFLKYIQRQVLELSKGVSICMIRNNILFTISEHRATQEESRTQNRNSFATNLSKAPSSHHQNTRPAFSLWD